MPVLGALTPLSFAPPVRRLTAAGTAAAGAASAVLVGREPCNACARGKGVEDGGVEKINSITKYYKDNNHEYEILNTYITYIGLFVYRISIL